MNNQIYLPNFLYENPEEKILTGDFQQVWENWISAVCEISGYFDRFTLDENLDMYEKTNEYQQIHELDNKYEAIQKIAVDFCKKHEDEDLFGEKYYNALWEFIYSELNNC